MLPLLEVLKKKGEFSMKWHKVHTNLQITCNYSDYQ